MKILKQSEITGVIKCAIKACIHFLIRLTGFFSTSARGNFSLKVSGNYKLRIILALYFAVAMPNLAPLIRRNISITSTTFP